MVVPNLHKIIALGHDVRLQGHGENEEIHIPKGPKFSSSANTKGVNVYTDKWHTGNTKVDPSKRGVKAHARKKSKGKGDKDRQKSNFRPKKPEGDNQTYYNNIF